MRLPAHQWFAAQVRSSLEQHVAESLRERQYDAFLPTYVRRRRWSDRIKVDQAPLFPGYVLFRATEFVSGPVYAIRGVIRLVGFGGSPMAIPEAEIEAIQRAVESGRVLTPSQYLTAGDMVRVVAGPLSGVEGRFITSKPRDRLVLSINLLQRSVVLEIDRHEVEPAALSAR